MTEAEVIREVMLALGSRRDCIVVRRNVGKAKDTRTGQVITFNIPGEADLQVLLRGGRYLYLEAKAPKGKQRPDQITFERRIVELGGSYRIVRSAAEALAALEEVIRG